MDKILKSVLKSSKKGKKSKLNTAIKLLPIGIEVAKYVMKNKKKFMK